MAFPKFKGLGAVLGAAGRSIISRAQAAGRSLAETLGLLREVEIEPSPVEVADEWEEVYEADLRVETFADLGGRDYVPQDWYEETKIPWKRPLGYTVEVMAWDLEKKEYVTQELHMTASRPLTVEQIYSVTESRIGETGASPKWAIEEIRLIGALRREGEPWRW